MKSPVKIDDLLAYLKKQPLVTSLELTSCDKTMTRSVYKLRARLFPNTYQLYIRIIQTPTELVYSYQLLTEHPIIRWDNAPHFHDMSTYPHHFHDLISLCFGMCESQHKNTITDKILLSSFPCDAILVLRKRCIGDELPTYKTQGGVL